MRESVKEEIKEKGVNALRRGKVVRRKGCCLSSRTEKKEGSAIEGMKNKEQSKGVFVCSYRRIPGGRSEKIERTGARSERAC